MTPRSNFDREPWIRRIRSDLDLARMGRFGLACPCLPCEMMFYWASRFFDKSRAAFFGVRNFPAVNRVNCI